MRWELIFTKQVTALMKGLPDFSEEGLCEYLTGNDKTWKKTAEEHDGALECAAEASFADLDELESLTKDQFTGAQFVRLEIVQEHLYYDLMLNVDGRSMIQWIEEKIDLKISWVVHVPGEVVSSNADEDGGRTLTWDMRRITPSSHIRVESKVGGSDPTVWIVLVILMTGCCAAFLAAAGGAAAFYFLGRKKKPTAENRNPVS